MSVARHRLIPVAGMGTGRWGRCERTVVLIFITIVTMVMMATAGNDWYRYENRVVIRVVIMVSFDFYDLRRRLVDDDLRFWWRLLAFLFFCHRGRRKYG